MFADALAKLPNCCKPLQQAKYTVDKNPERVKCSIDMYRIPNYISLSIFEKPGSFFQSY